MFDVSNFLLRWMFLSNLCRDVADIQTLPTQPYYDHQHQHQQQQHLPPQQPHHYPAQQHQHPETVWKEQCLRGILSYPPGSQRTLVLDALRTELVQQLAHKLQLDQSILHQDRDSTAAASTTVDGVRRRRSLGEEDADDDEISDYEDDEDSSSDPFLDADLEIVRAFGEGDTQSSAKPTTSKKPLAKRSPTDSEKQTASLVIDEYGPSVIEGAATEDSSSANLQQSTLGQRRPDRDDAYREKSHSSSNSHIKPSAFPELVPPPDYLARVHEASRSLQLTRDYLPQLVAAVLKSPPAFDPEVVNPIQKLRSLLLQRCCLDDPGVGIELCWLLEAEVGRAWKTLFEHRQQQPGRRLIVVLPADRAMALAKIGSEKREAFDWLQEAEQATAFGCTTATDATIREHHEHHHSPLHSSMDDTQHYLHHQQQQQQQHHSSSRLPSSLSLSRCSHFGDTMHFIDKLTQLSSDLRMVPELHRKAILEEGLHELNRRLRRRMVTRGNISLDVEDHRSPHDWPQIQDMSVDVMAHSVHLPLVPQTGRWPDGEASSTTTTTTAPVWHTSMPPSQSTATTTDATLPSHDVVRVLNIVVPETRILSSRERCPFLIHVEVADTGLETSNARLYASSASTTGLTVREALGLRVAHAPAAAAGSSSGHHWNLPTRPWGIPKELLLEDKPKRRNPKTKHSTEPVGGEAQNEQSMANAAVYAVADDDISPSATGLSSADLVTSSRPFPPRGGFQTDGHYYDENGYLYDPLASARQQEFEQLHHDLHAQPAMMASPPSSQQQILHNFPKVTLGSDLLDNIFGREWNEKCKEIRDASPYGHLKGWRLASFIMKSGEDIRREAFVMQIITKLQQWFQVIPESHRPILRPYTIMCVGADAGLVECLSNAKSIDEVKKQTDGFESLRDYFERAYGPPHLSKAHQQHHHHHPQAQQQYHPHHPHQHSADLHREAISFEKAQDNFLRSLVGYSLVCYILQVKDRHNANILIDRFARVVHIDYGFVLGDTPKMGKVPLFSERAPFKLSSEFWDVLGGWNFHAGGLGVQFCKMFEIAFACAAVHSEEIATLAEAAMLSLDSNARSARIVANGIRARLRMRGPPGSRAQKMFIMDLVNAALTSWGTSTYDWLQRSMNGYQ